MSETDTILANNPELLAAQVQSLLRDSWSKLQQEEKKAREFHCNFTLQFHCNFRGAISRTISDQPWRAAALLCGGECGLILFGDILLSFEHGPLGVRQSACPRTRPAKQLLQLEGSRPDDHE